MAKEPIRALSTPTVCRLADIALTTLDYWVHTGLVAPSVRASSGRRVTRLWAVQDVVLVRSVKALREAGCPLQKVREVKALLGDQWNEGLEDYVLYWDGGDVIGLDRWGHLRSLLRKPSQQVLHLVAIPVEPWRQEAQAAAVVVPDSALKPRRSRSVRTETRKLAL